MIETTYIVLGYEVGVLDMVLLCGLVVVFGYQLYYYVRYMAGVQRRVRHQAKGRWRWNKERQKAKAEKARMKAEKAAEKMRAAAEKAGGAYTAAEYVMPEDATAVARGEKPGVSVVVCARNEGRNLESYLQALLSQDYPTFEVIVVNDASEDNTQLVLDHYTQYYQNLHLSFVPADAMVRSSKKLALTLAAKAAKYDYLLLTDADCRPESAHWISEMMQGFYAPETEVVLGYGGYFSEKKYVNRVIQYDTIFNAMQYLGMAMSRHPYMGVGRNLAYKKETFFRNRGFAGLLNQRAGDDDLFINKVCTRKNTEVVLTADSYTWSVPKATYKEWRLQKRRHLSVAPAYKWGTKVRMAWEPMSRGLWYALLVATFVLAGMGTVTPWLAAVAGVLFVARLTWQIAMMNRAASILGAPHFGLSVLWMDVTLPLVNLELLIYHRLHKKAQQQW